MPKQPEPIPVDPRHWTHHVPGDAKNPPKQDPSKLPTSYPNPT